MNRLTLPTHATPAAGPLYRYARLPGQAVRDTVDFDSLVEQSLQTLRDAAAAHPGRIVLTTSLGAEDMVLTDLIARQQLPIALATLDTGTLHAQTLALLPRIQARYGLQVERWHPEAQAVLHFVAKNGSLPMRQSIHLRKQCCALRKLQPLQRLLQGRTAWVTGLRREQSGARAELPALEIDGQGRSKFSPLANWRWADVWHYIEAHQVPYNELHDDFFPSIGCEPCTRAVSPGEDLRAGRWWWEDEAAKECGLHVAPTSALRPQRLQAKADHLAADLTDHTTADAVDSA